MTGREMHIATERQLGMFSEELATRRKPNSNTVFYYLNKSQTDLINEYRKIGVERSEDAKSRLGNLFKEASVDTTSITKDGILNGLEVTIATDSWYILSELVTVLNSDSESINVKVKPVSRDYFNDNDNNPFKKPDVEELCWSFEKDGNRVLVYPGDINTYKYSYIRKPTVISTTTTSDLNESVHEELVAKAVQYMINQYAATKQS